MLLSSAGAARRRAATRGAFVAAGGRGTYCFGAAPTWFTRLPWRCRTEMRAGSGSSFFCSARLRAEALEAINVDVWHGHNPKMHKTRCLMDPHVVKLSPPLERVRGGVPWRATRTPVSAEFASNFNLALNSKCATRLHAKNRRGDLIDWAATRKTRLWKVVAGLQRRARNRRAHSEQQQKPRGGALQPKKQP